MKSTGRKREMPSARTKGLILDVAASSTQNTEDAVNLAAAIQEFIEGWLSKKRWA